MNEKRLAFKHDTICYTSDQLIRDKNQNSFEMITGIQIFINSSLNLVLKNTFNRFANIYNSENVL